MVLLVWPLVGDDRSRGGREKNISDHVRYEQVTPPLFSKKGCAPEETGRLKIGFSFAAARFDVNPGSMSPLFPTLLRYSLACKFVRSTECTQCWFSGVQDVCVLVRGLRHLATDSCRRRLWYINVLLFYRVVRLWSARGERVPVT